MLREAVLEFSSSIQHFLQVAGVSLLIGMGLLVFGVWLHRLGVLAVARQVFCSVRGVFAGSCTSRAGHVGGDEAEPRTLSAPVRW